LSIRAAPHRSGSGSVILVDRLLVNKKKTLGRLCCGLHRAFLLSSPKIPRWRNEVG
jgi:hypothetical protein